MIHLLLERIIIYHEERRRNQLSSTLWINNYLEHLHYLKIAPETVLSVASIFRERGDVRTAVQRQIYSVAGSPHRMIQALT